jgi:hypothetical protein
MIDVASALERRCMQENAEAALAQLNAAMQRGSLSRDQRKAAEVAIEVLTRLEATRRRQGWWYRVRRRVRLAQLHLGVAKAAMLVLLMPPVGA